MVEKISTKSYQIQVKKTGSLILWVLSGVTIGSLLNYRVSGEVFIGAAGIGLLSLVVFLLKAWYENKYV